MIDNKIFNTLKTDYSEPSILLGKQELGLFDTVNKRFPNIWKCYKSQKSLDWDENEFDYNSCNKEFKTCSKDVYDIMIKTLAFQWEADSIAAKSIAPILAPFITSSEAWAAIQRIGDNEVIHAATYSEIVRSSFDNPNEVIDEVLSSMESLTRLVNVSKVFSEGYKASHEYALGIIPNNQETYNKAFMMICALFTMERIQFMSSFAVTFSICDTGLFIPIGKAVQKIAQDELEVHVQNGKAMIEYELKTERGQIAMEQCFDAINTLVDDVLDSELEFNAYLFTEGRTLVGINRERLDMWSAFCAKDVYNFFGMKSKITLPRNNPLKFMEKWLNIGKTQPSPQEESNGQYKVGIMRRTDTDMEFDDDF